MHWEETLLVPCSTDAANLLPSLRSAAVAAPGTARYIVLEINVESNDEGEGYHLCRLTGEVDAYTVGQFREALAGIDGVKWLLIDLSEVPFMDSAGLGALIGGIRRVREAEGDVAVVSTTTSLNRLLHTTGFDRIVPVTESIDEALAALREA